ncbi:MAG: TetR/AcrR family transcriptional regulator [Hyphomonadaceae bacterium]
MSARPQLSGGTVDLILDAAERRAQVLGFNGFSYADVAGELGVTAASIHYHFPAKTDLGVRLIERYTQRFLAALAQIERHPDGAWARLQDYAGIYERVLAEGRLCLCGILAAEYETLPERMRGPIGAFFGANEDWLTAQLSEGRQAGVLAFEGEPRGVAAALTGALEGAMLVARARGGAEAFVSTSALALRSLCQPLSP